MPERPNVVPDTDLHELALKGEVRQVIRRVSTAERTWVTAVVDFERAGRRIQTVDHTLTTVADDGSRTETDIVVGAQSWTSRFVQDIGFGCEDAAIARTLIDGSGVPRHTTFEDGQRRLVARLDYVSDPSGRVTSAVHRHVFFGRGLRPIPAAQGALLERLPEFSRLDRVFTKDGDITSQVFYMAGPIMSSHARAAHRSVGNFRGRRGTRRTIRALRSAKPVSQECGCRGSDIRVPGFLSQELRAVTATDE